MIRNRRPGMFCGLSPIPAVLACFLVLGVSGCSRKLLSGAGSFFGIRSADLRYSVEDRLVMYGPAVRSRIAPYFQRAGLTYPPERLLLLALKEERLIEVYASSAAVPQRLVMTYPIVAASGTWGPKLREGDEQVPEGFYRIESLNPNSRFHLSLRVNYPNEFDRQVAAYEGRDKLGGDIMIHGSSVSTGCLAMGDKVAEELFVLAADVGIEQIEVIASPVDFRRRSIPDAEFQKLPFWVQELYKVLESTIREL